MSPSRQKLYFELLEFFKTVIFLYWLYQSPIVGNIEGLEIFADETLQEAVNDVLSDTQIEAHIFYDLI